MVFSCQGQAVQGWSSIALGMGDSNGYGDREKTVIQMVSQLNPWKVEFPAKAWDSRVELDATGDL